MTKAGAADDLINRAIGSGDRPLFGTETSEET
jgi:hypothetical protein